VLVLGPVLEIGKAQIRTALQEDHDLVHRYSTG
jgi:hypothetical protein